MLELPLGLIDWAPETFVALIVILVLTERLVGRGRLTEKNKEIALWRAKSERETSINETQAESISNFANAALLKEEVSKALRDRQAPHPSPPEGK